MKTSNIQCGLIVLGVVLRNQRKLALREALNAMSSGNTSTSISSFNYRSPCDTTQVFESRISSMSDVMRVAKSQTVHQSPISRYKHMKPKKPKFLQVEDRYQHFLNFNRLSRVLGRIFFQESFVRIRNVNPREMLVPTPKFQHRISKTSAHNTPLRIRHKRCLTDQDYLEQKMVTEVSIQKRVTAHKRSLSPIRYELPSKNHPKIAQEQVNIGTPFKTYQKEVPIMNKAFKQLFEVKKANPLVNFSPTGFIEHQKTLEELRFINQSEGINNKGTFLRFIRFAGRHNTPQFRESTNPKTKYWIGVWPLILLLFILALM